ncbi:hypothetical protein [Treponema zioleckii]|jgi:hypothetical protein|uniref:hypothetical protein n=1 Tax=Treponema zioleckii TaxID=331680 RepID=UPI00168AA3CD|nr:hypothetical protein [Treponema zioleckii]
MKVLELNQVRTDDNYIYYRRNYTALAKLELLSKTLDIGISFTIETGPFGDKVIYVDLAPGVDLDYPIIPVKSAIKNYILIMDNEGKLPCA